MTTSIIINPGIYMAGQATVEIFAIATTKGLSGMNIHFTIQTRDNIVFEGIVPLSFPLNKIIQDDQYKDYKVEFHEDSYHLMIHYNMHNIFYKADIPLIRTSTPPMVITRQIAYEKKVEWFNLSIKNNMKEKFESIYPYSDSLQNALNKIANQDAFYAIITGKHLDVCVKYGYQCCYFNIDTHIIILQKLPKKITRGPHE